MPHVVFRIDQNVVLDKKKVSCDFRKGNKDLKFSGNKIYWKPQYIRENTQDDRTEGNIAQSKTD